MVKYKFKNKGLKLYDLLTFALALRPEDRGWFIQNLGKDIFGYYNRDIINVFYYNISHDDSGLYRERSYNMLVQALIGNTRVNEYGDIVGDTKAVEDMRQILKILNNPDDVAGQRFLFELLKEWERLPKKERHKYGAVFATICQDLLLNPDNTFRIKDPDIKKELMFKIADNTYNYDRFFWYVELLKTKDIQIGVGEIKFIYHKMLETEFDYIQLHKNEEMYVSEILKKTKGTLDAMIHLNQDKSSVKFQKLMTYEELAHAYLNLQKENERLRNALMFAKRVAAPTQNGYKM